MFIENRSRKMMRKEMRRIELIYSIPLRSHLYIHDTRSHIYSGLYEYKVAKYLTRKAKESESCLFIDVGAYIGYYSILIAGGYNILAFEPDPGNFVLLLNNIAMGELGDKIKAFNIAICDCKFSEGVCR